MAELVVPDPAVVVLIGAAGSGKSTFAARHFPPGSVLSSDALREAIAGNAADQRATRPAFVALHRALDRRLEQGRLTVIDATNVKAADRRALRLRAERHRVPVVAVVFDLPADLVHRRNSLREGRVVPPEIVDAQLRWLRRSIDRSELAAEGFAAIAWVRSAADLDAIRVRIEAAPPAPPRAPAPA